GPAGDATSRRKSAREAWGHRVGRLGEIRPARVLSGSCANLSVVIPGRATDLGSTRDRRLKVPKSATADLGGASPESIITGGGYGFRAPSLRSRPGMTADGA